MKKLNDIIFISTVLLFISLHIYNINIIENTVKEKIIIKVVNRDYDIDKIAKVIYRECANCLTIDKIMIGSSILNRLDDCRFPSSIDKVIKGQYAISDTFDADAYRIARMLVKDSLRECNVLYFFNPKTATDISFVKSIKKHDLLVKTKYHEYYN